MTTMQIRRFGQLEYQAKEAFNTLCTNLFFTGADIKKIMLTSTLPSEGKSFIAMNLMRSLADQGRKVVLVDADIRASALQGSYDIKIVTEDGSRYSGLTKYLSGGCAKEEILAQTSIPNAWMILAGHNVTNSLPLLSSPRLGELLDWLSKDFDVVLVDAAPAGTIIDAAKIVTNCDGTLFVVESGQIRRQELKETIMQLEKTGKPVLGTVLNKFDERKYGNRSYYYHKSYYSKYYYKKYGYYRYGSENNKSENMSRKKSKDTYEEYSSRHSRDD